MGPMATSRPHSRHLRARANDMSDTSPAAGDCRLQNKRPAEAGHLPRHRGERLLGEVQRRPLEAPERGVTADRGIAIIAPEVRVISAVDGSTRAGFKTIGLSALSQ